jgi:hypothetical protein
MMRIVVADESTYETDHNIGGKRGFIGAKGCGISGQELRHSCSQHHERDGKTTDWSDSAHADF